MTYYDFTRRRRPLTPKGYFLRRQKRRDWKLGFQGWPVRVEQIVHPDHLYQCYQEMRQEGGQAPGVDGLTYDDLSPSEVGQQVRSLAKSVLAGTYRPQQTRPAQIPKPKGGTRTLQIATLFDRVLGKALYRAWSPYWELRVFLPCSYGFRPCRNPWRMLADLEVTVLCEGRAALAIDDIISAYDNVPIAPVIQLFDKAMHSPDFKMTEEDKQRSLRLVDTVLRGHDQNRTIGLHQGNPFSPLALNVLLHDLVDAPLGAETIPSWFRYADNLVYAAQDVSEGRTAIERVRGLLHSQNLALKQQDGVVNLSRGQTTQLLGYSLWLREGQMAYGLDNDALDRLTCHLIGAHKEDDPPAAANYRLLGWMDSMGPAFANGVVAEALLAAVRCGFRTICPASLLRQRGRLSQQRWLATRERAYRRRGPPIRG